MPGRMLTSNTAATAPATLASPHNTFNASALAPAVAGVEQHREVANLLRHFVRGDGRGGADAQRHRGQHRGADHRAVHEVVDGPADQHQRRRDAVHLAGVGVTVPPEDGLLEDEEPENPRQQRPEHLRRRPKLERLGQQRHQRHAQQGPDGVAHQPRHQARAPGGGQQQEQRRTQQPTKAAGQRERDCGEQAATRDGIIMDDRRWTKDE